MAFNRSLISLILAALSLSISAQAPDEPSLTSLVYDTALLCLDVTNGVDADGTPLQISTCVAGDASQQWISAGQIGGTPHICVNVPNGDVTAGTVLQITECDATFNDIDQNWGIAIQN
ncbi:hypothetical protein B0H13DRAFT_2353632 [Mycena leptocephala]|nr:hypothetical protein B0H13DRAFT_2353632 [Mycena leptocephala]